jgi:hypothetical protein
MNNCITCFYFIVSVTWLLSTVKGDNKIDDAKKCSKIAGNFDHVGDVAVQSGAHRQMQHIKDFTRSHWMLPLGECLSCIAPTAGMVGNFGGKHKTITKTTFSYSTYSRPKPKVVTILGGRGHCLFVYLY